MADFAGAYVSSAASIQLLVDRAAIHDLLMRYCAGVDRRDFDLVASCFSSDVRARYGPHEFLERDGLIDFIRGVRAFDMTMHAMANQFIEIDGDEARAESYAMLTHHGKRPDGTDFEYNESRALYVDGLSRREGNWLIHERGRDPAWSPRGVTGVDSDDRSVRWLLDRAEIYDVLMQYALGVDRREYERLRTIFARDAHVSYGDHEFRQTEDLIEAVRDLEHLDSTTHFLAHPLIEIHGDEAWVRTDAMITQREPGHQPARPGEAAGRLSRESTTTTVFFDRLVRSDGCWRIAERGFRRDRPLLATLAVLKSDDPTVQRLLDRAAIHDSIARSAIALDENSSGVETTHFLANQTIELDGDVASAETYVYRTQQGGPADMRLPWSRGAQRFLDRLERRGGEWQIAERQVADNRPPPTPEGC